MASEAALENATVDELNASNLTGRDAASPGGILITYTSLFMMALAPIVIGSLRSVSYHHHLKTKGEEPSDRIEMKDAAMFPFFASGGLFGIYLFFKYVPKEYVNLVLNLLFLGLGMSALIRAACKLLDPLIPAFISDRVTRYHLAFTILPAKTDKEQEPIEETKYDFNSVHIIIALVCLGLGAVYFFTRNWMLNNIIGLAFSLNAIELISLDRILVGCLLLGGLFVYDIFWVFGTDVMVTVAKGLDAPIKLMFPMDILEKGLAASNFGMLGLGDIVVPGLFIALLCRFDFNHHPLKSRMYFYTGFVAYILGLLTTIGIMHFFKAAQPALLYLVPSCLGLPFLLALVRGDIPALLKYKDYPDAVDKDGTKKGSEKAE